MTQQNLFRPPSPNRSLPLVMIVLASCSWAPVALAQDPNAPAAPPSSDTPTAPATDVKKPKASADAATEAVEPATTKRKNPFRTGESTRTDGSARRNTFSRVAEEEDVPRRKLRRTGLDTTDEQAEKSAAESLKTEESDNRFVAPSFYGRAPQVVTPGKGEFARPRFRYGISIGVGYDDNPDQTPSGTATTVGRPRARSGFTWVNGHWDAQWIKASSVFTVNAEVGADFYWDRPGGSSDFNARLGTMYIKRINPRTQFSANASFAYLSQPDYSNYYASTSQVGGDYFTGSTKFDLSYRWAPRFSTTTSASFNILQYANDSAANQSNSYWNFTIGNEFRFQTSPRYTWVIEGRYGFDEYMNNSTLNSQTAYALAGLDWIASRYLTATIRAGASFRFYDVGGNSSAPYGEIALNYRTGRNSTLTLNGRYGFEQSSTAGDRNLSYRLGLIYQRAFTSRLSGNVGFNYIHTDYESRAGATSSTDIYDANVGLQYRIDRHFSLGARYNYTLQDTSIGTADYDRNRFLFSIQYEY